MTPAVMAVVNPPLRAEIPEKRAVSAQQEPRALRSASPNMEAEMGWSVTVAMQRGPFLRREKRGKQ